MAAMTLKDILYKVAVKELRGSTGTEIEKICIDSREVGPGDLFVARRGTSVDAHKFIPAAIEQGAMAIVCEEIPGDADDQVTWIQVQSSARALGIMASNLYGKPSSQICLCGVTGTNGKTTIASLLYQLFSELGYACGLLSTIRVMIADRELPATHTTPDALNINRMLKEMAEAGCSYCFMEVSSHAIDQERIAGLEFDGGIFTNITHDHLDYHGDFKAYIGAKKAFFDQLPARAFALSNADDKNGRIMLQNTAAKKHTYALKTPANFRARVLENLIDGLMLEIGKTEVWCRLIGEFNAYNLLAVYATALLLGQEQERVLTLLSRLNTAEGRFEYVRSENGITAIVDYAHTPDALQNVLRTINAVRTGNEELITVVGTGGDRDTTKRPLMGKIAGELSTRVILTSDNPRSEEPEEIIRQMKEGVAAIDHKKLLVITNRREAIHAACAMARPGDIILVAGKGHEKYQEIKGVKQPFDDKAILNEKLTKTA